MTLSSHLDPVPTTPHSGDFTVTVTLLSCCPVIGQERTPQWAETEQFTTATWIGFDSQMVITDY